MFCGVVDPMRSYVAQQISSTTPQRPPTTPHRPSTTSQRPSTTPQNGVLDNIILDFSTTPVCGVVGGCVERITPQRVYHSTLLACMSNITNRVTLESHLERLLSTQRKTMCTLTRSLQCEMPGNCCLPEITR